MAKIKVAIYDNDFKIRKLKDYDIAQDGERISIVNSGAGKFMPQFDNTSFLEFPSFKKYLLFGERSYKRLYIVKNGGEKCVNFYTGEAVGPSIEEKSKANLGALANRLGQDSGLTIPWYFSIPLVLVLVFQIWVLSMLGAF